MLHNINTIIFHNLIENLIENITCFTFRLDLLQTYNNKKRSDVTKIVLNLYAHYERPIGSSIKERKLLVWTKVWTTN